MHGRIKVKILKEKLLDKLTFAQLVAPQHAIRGIVREVRYSSTHS